MTALPFITDVKRGSIDDGPGIRTTVFFKGCPLQCIWCHNPETISPGQELAITVGRCLGTACRACAGSCHAVDNGVLATRSCIACGVCAQSCPTSARRLVGRRYSITELTPLLLRDRQFYFASGGGVTLSGGEPTLHHHYVATLLQKLKAQGINTAIQTCGLFDFDSFRRTLLPHLDLVFFDLKLIDTAEHRYYTGMDNQVILTNFSQLAGEIGTRLIPRTPLVPHITATRHNLTAIAALLRRTGISACELLPYNPGGIEKRRNLRLPIPPGLPQQFMPHDEERRLTAIFREALQPRISAANH